VDQRRHFGDAWIAAGKAQAVIVPSMIIPLGFGPVATGEANALLNPRFATSWRVTQAPFQLDDRLRRPA
jgi:hypothetical protein